MQFIARKILLRRDEALWMARANNSLPEPVSPRIKIVELLLGRVEKVVICYKYSIFIIG